MPLRVRAVVPCAVMALFFAVPAVAGAATISYSRTDGGAVVYSADTQPLDTTIGFESEGCTAFGSGSYDCVTFSGDAISAVDTIAQNSCVQASGRVLCALDPDHSGVRIVGGSGADDVGILDSDIGGFPAATPYAIRVDGGDGNDHLVGGSAGETLDGGAGVDVVTGMGGDDVIDGGDGNDTLGGDSDDQHDNVSEGGNDVIHGGAGDDTLTGDASSVNAVIGRDVLDGGPGTDTIVNDWYRYDGNGDDQDPAPTITFDGVANDGRPGENDDVLAVEHVKSGAPAGATPATYVGDDGPDVFDLVFTNGVVRAGGGDDIVTGSDYADTIDGGAGNDKLSGGFGPDDITGGPGSDDIGGDRSAACFWGPVYGTCTIGSGDDTIHAQDGERDTVDCGPGADVAYVDAIDVVTACETIHESGSSPPGPSPTCCSPPPAPHPRPQLSVPRQHLRKAAHARILKATCRLTAPGRCTVRATITRKAARTLHLKAKRHAKAYTLGSAHRTLPKPGKATVRMKLSRRTARALRRAHSLKVTFKATARYADGSTRTKTVRKTLHR